MDAHQARVALEKLCKWRTVFAGWQLGTRPKGDPEADAVRDHREVTMLLRAEVNALTRVLIEKGVVTQEEWTGIVGEEADHLSAGYAKRFPGMEATEHGIAYDLARIREHGTMKDWLP